MHLERAATAAGRDTRADNLLKREAVSLRVHRKLAIRKE